MFIHGKIKNPLEFNLMDFIQFRKLGNYTYNLKQRLERIHDSN